MDINISQFTEQGLSCVNVSKEAIELNVVMVTVEVKPLNLCT